MARIIRSDGAEKDLDGIWDYIAQDNPAKADEWLRLLNRKIEMLAESPHMGRERSEFLPGLRSFAVGNYVIFYRVMESGIEIVRLLHGGRDLGALLH